MACLEDYTYKFTTLFFTFVVTIFSVCSQASEACKSVNDPLKLAELRENAEAFGKQGNVWLMTKGGFPMRCEALDETAQICQTASKGSAVSFLKGKLVAGVEFDGSASVKFTFDESGKVKCSGVKANLEVAEQESPPVACNIISDTLTLYKLLEDSSLLLQFGKAKLMLKKGSPAPNCKSNASSVLCVTSEKALVILDAPDSPLKAIQANGVEAIEMSFHDSGDLGCGTVKELERYRK